MAGNQQGSRTEEIDERILQLLGLEDTFDLDYDDYISLLKEKLIEISRGGGETSTEDAMLLREEMKRAKQKKGEGTFKAKKKISKESFTNFNVTKKISGTDTTTSKKTPLLLSGTKSEKISKEIEEKSKKVSEKKSEEDNSIYSSIIKSLDNIIKILSNQLNFDKKESENQRKLAEREKRKGKEGKMESAFSKGLQAISKVASKVFDPLQEFFNRLINFVVWTFLGVAFKKFMNWYKDPENEKKLDTIGKLIKDFWPALLVGVLAFMTPLGGLVLWMSKFLIKWTGRLLKFVLPNLLKFVTKHPRAIGAAALFTAGAWVPKLFPQTVDEQERKTEAAPGSKEEKIEKLKKQKESLNPLQRLQGVGAEIDEQIYKLETGETKKYEFGGFVSGKKGIDQIPAMLSDGEFVMSRGAVQKYGADTLAAMNAAGGGTNRPVTANGVTRATGGGPTGRDKRGRNARADKTASNVPTAPHKEPGLPEIPSASSKPPKKTDDEKVSNKGLNTQLEGSGGASAVISAGRQILKQGFTVAEHPNFRKNNYSGSGANTGLGYNPNGGERVGGHSSGSAHYKGLAIDVTDWRPGDWLGRTKSLAESIYQNRKALKVTQIIHDPWGSWFAGGGKGGPYGGHDEHLHLAFASGPGGGNIGDSASGPGSNSYDNDGGGGGDGSGGGGDGSGGGSSAPSLTYDEFTKLMSKEFSPNEMASSVISNTSGLMKEKMGKFSPNEITGKILSKPSQTLLPTRSRTYSDSELNSMTDAQLNSALDPTKTGASNPAVFAAAKAARERAVAEGLSKEQIERRVKIETIKAKQSPQSSGLIKENSGMNVPGGGSDRVLLRGKPGEYMLPVDAVSKLGGSFRIDKLVANLDSKSNPAKMGLRNKDISEGIRPYDVNSSGGVDVSSMPLSMGGKSGPNFMSKTGSNDPFHAPFFTDSFSERQRILDTMGISAFG